MAVSANRLELLQIAEAVAREKSIDKSIVLGAMQEAIAKAARSRYGIWKRVSYLNERHAWFAWLSLFSVVIVDFYIRLVASGAIQDIRFF